MSDIGNKVVLAYSGGLDTSVIVPWLKENYDCEVIDPGGWTLKGVPSRAVELDPSEASYYDLIVGLHPDEATRAVAQAALIRPAILIPCCNFWSEGKLGRDELIETIERYYRTRGIGFERVTFSFRGPKNIGLVSEPPDFADASWPATFARFLRARIPTGYREEFSSVNGFVPYNEPVVVGTTPMVYPVRIIPGPEIEADFIVDAGGRGGLGGVRGQVVRIIHDVAEINPDQNFLVR